jgi:hypothetical protein
MRDISAIITGNISLHRVIIYNLLIVIYIEYIKKSIY